METLPVNVENVDFSYRRRPVLRGVSWGVGYGVTALLGPNGAGKTTLIKCLTGLFRAQSGKITIKGRSIRDGLAIQRLIGYVPQNPVLPGLSKVQDVVAYAAWLSGVSSAAMPAAVDGALSAMEVSDLARRRVRTLSGGQRQRVALAAGVVHDPAVLVLDEPTVGLDPGQRLKVRGVIKDIGRTRPVVLSTHLTEDVQHLATTVSVLVGGTIRFSGTMDELSASVPCRDDDDRPGSDFERAYDDIMARHGGHE